MDLFGKCHRPHGGAHVQRDAGFGRFHYNANRQSRFPSKRNFVFVRFGAGSSFWWRSCFACWTRFAAFTTAASSCPGRTATEQLHRFADHAQLASFLSALFIVPSVELETAFDKNRATFF